MKRKNCIITFAVLALLLVNIIASGVSLRTVKADAQYKKAVQFYNIGVGQTWLTNETTHTSSYDAKLMIPSSEQNESGCMVLYPYSNSLNSLQSFQVYTSFTNAVPSFVIILDTNGDGLPELVLLSDPQYSGVGNWQLTQGGQRWGWTEASLELSTYGKIWNTLSYWKGIHGDATVLFVGAALEYNSVKNSAGFDKPLYADEIVLNGVTYNIDPASNQVPINWYAPTPSTQISSAAILDHRLSGEASITNESVHTDPSSVKLVIPSNATQGSCAMALYPYNKSLSTLTSFSVWASYTTAVPRFVIYLDTNNDGLTDLILLSDYQFQGNSQWQISAGGNRWGWSTANTQLNNYGAVWNPFDYWKIQYGNSTVLYVGIALEYWAVLGQGGLNQPLYADEALINGATTPTSNQSSNGSTLDNWSMFHHDLQRTGSSTSAASNGNPLWQFFTDPSTNPSLADRLRASPTVVNGVVYIGSNNSYFYALNATNGIPIWQVNVGSVVESSAAVVDNVVYVGILWNGQNGYVDALNASTGSVIWRFATNSGIESSPAVVNGIVYVGSFYGYIYALNATNGALIWSYLTGGSTFSSPAIIDSFVFIGSNDGKVYALNANNGAVIWSFQTGDHVYSSPAVVNNILYVNSDNGTLYALKTHDGTEIWQAAFGNGDHADDSPAVAGGIVYIGTRNGYYAFNATDGSQIWFFTSPYSPRQFTGYIYSSPAVAGNVVYFGSLDSYIFALNAYDGSMIWSYRTGGFLFSSPAIVNGTVYIGSYDGKVYALGASAPTPTSTSQPIATPSAAPTSSPKPAPIATSEPTATPNTTVTPVATSTPNQDPSPLPITQPAARPALAVEPNDNGTADWIVFGIIVVIAIIALISLVFIFKRSD